MSKRFSIAFQGAPGAFSHQAAMVFAEQIGAADAEYVSCQSFAEMFERVVSGVCDYGAMPMENSSIGSITANFDLLWAADIKIVAEYFLPVHHHLIGFPGVSLAELKTVYSHPAALDQCRLLFQRNAHLSPRVHWDTSGSVRDVKASGERSSAAIASERAAHEYGMTIIERDIEDYPHNATRFGLITAVKTPQALPELPFKMSVAMELEHRAGTLAAALNALAAAGVNLTKIESRPIGETPWHYRFFMDIESTDVPADNIVSALEQCAVQFKLLGQYKAALQSVN